jgi:hypothetical protein
MLIRYYIKSSTLRLFLNGVE